MAMRIAFQMPNSAPCDDDGIKQAVSNLRRNTDLTRAPDTEVDFRVMEEGALSAVCSFDNASSQFLELQNGPALVEAIVSAERDGYDAVIIGCAHDPVLAPARQAVDIPIVGLTHASALYAHLIGARYGIVTISKAAGHIVRERVESYGLGSALVGVTSLNTSFADQAAGMMAANEEALSDFIDASRPLIDQGAEVIYPACGGSSLMLRLMSGMNEYPDGVTEIDGVPIIDQLSVAVKVAELLVSMKRAGSPWISRVAAYARPGADILSQSAYQPPEVGPIWNA